MWDQEGAHISSYTTSKSSCKKDELHHLEKVAMHASNASLLGGFWPKTMRNAVHVRSPTKSLDNGISLEPWTGKKPSYSHFAHIWV